MKKITKFDVDRLFVENGSLQQQFQQDNIIREVPVALVYNGISHT
ncbi:formate dehydrogenase accessory -like domain protein, partial [Glaesserella parasuis 84-15995]